MVPPPRAVSGATQRRSLPKWTHTHLTQSGLADTLHFKNGSRTGIWFFWARISQRAVTMPILLTGWTQVQYVNTDHGEAVHQYRLRMSTHWECTLHIGECNTLSNPCRCYGNSSQEIRPLFAKPFWKGDLVWALSGVVGCGDVTSTPGPTGWVTNWKLGTIAFLVLPLNFQSSNINPPHQGAAQYGPLCLLIEMISFGGGWPVQPLFDGSYNSLEKLLHVSLPLHIHS